MADPVTVPRLGWSMEEGTFVEWLKRDGDRIEQGDALFVLESEKAAENIEAIDAGILRLDPNGPKPGEKVLVGQVLVYQGDGEPHLDRRGRPRSPTNGPAVSVRTPPVETRDSHEEPVVVAHPPSGSSRPGRAWPTSGVDVSMTAAAAVPVGSGLRTHARRRACRAGGSFHTPPRARSSPRGWSRGHAGGPGNL